LGRVQPSDPPHHLYKIACVLYPYTPG